jgi:tRNA threonylcarbamoyladenosine biosynthesis protein TsaE
MKIVGVLVFGMLAALYQAFHVKQLGPKLLSCHVSMRSQSGISSSFLWNAGYSVDAMEDAGKHFKQHVLPGTVVLLKGPLGAGKTSFARGLIRAIYNDFSMKVNSPSYLLCNTYDCEGIIVNHIDLYRLPNNCDLSLLDIPNIYDESICIIEWPERMGKSLPPNYSLIQIVINSDGSRTISCNKPEV